MYVELFIAAIAAIVWSHSDNFVVRQHATGLMLSASLVTVLFNANPLMRFDGYYVLTDWLELPNLATHGNQFLRYLGNRYLLGVRMPKPVWPEGREKLVVGYSFAAFAWRIVICISLSTAATLLLHGAGIALACIAIAIWIGLPAIKLAKRVVSDSGVDRHRFASIVAATALLVVGSYLWMPWITRVSIPIVIDYETINEVRPATSGFVRHVLIDVGDEVNAGQVVAEFDNPELRFDLRQLNVELKQSLQRIRIHRRVHAIALIQAETSKYEALVERKTQLDQKIASLQVKATIDGIVTACSIIEKQSTYIRAGQSIATIGDPSSLKAHGLVHQDQARHLTSLIGRELPTTLQGAGDARSFRLKKIDPRASDHVLRPALTALAGGQIAVVQSPSDNESWRLAQPHVPVTFDIDTTSELRAGQTGVLKFSEYQPVFGWQM